MVRALLIGRPPGVELGYEYVTEEPYDAVVVGSLTLGQLLRFREERVLTALAVRWVQPGVADLAARVPGEVTWLCLLVFTVDALVSARLLWVTGDVELLRADMG